MLIPLVLLTLLPAPSRADSDVLSRFKALRFTQDPSSYIQFNPDFSQYTHAISVCGWIKSLGSASFPTVFYYGGTELTMLDNGNYMCFFGYCPDYRSKFTVSKRTWYHACVTWGASSRYHKYYVNGVLLASRQTASGRLLQTGRTLTLGNYGGDNSNHEFGGEMMYLNFYNKEMSASEVQKMADGGMCYDMAVREHEEVRLLKWEEILKKSRSGTITEIDMTAICASTTRLLTIVGQVETKLRTVESKLNETAEDLAQTRQELEEKKEREQSLDQELQNVSSQLNATLTELQGTNGELLECSTRLNETEEELGRATTELENYNKTRKTWDWNIFLSDQYINKTISTEQTEQIRSSWDSVARKTVIEINLYFIVIYWGKGQIP